MPRSFDTIRASASITAGLALGISTSHGATAFGVVATYDATGGAANAVDTNASGAALSSMLINDVAGFTTAVAAAYAGNTGGVIDMGNGASASATVAIDADQLNITYATSKTFTITTAVTLFSGATGSTTTDLRHNLGTLTPTSGFSALLPNRSTAVTSWAFNFGNINGGAIGEAITTIGFTLLSRDNVGENVTVSWFIDGSNSAIFSDTEAMAAGKTLDDTFFSYTAPTGSKITGFSIDFAGTTSATTDGRLGIDDIGFITSVIPEPSAIALLSAAGVIGSLRRRRI